MDHWTQLRKIQKKMFVFMFFEFLKANALFCHNRENDIKLKCGNETFCSSFDPAGLEGHSKIENKYRLKL